jgi:hypothetical protein
MGEQLAKGIALSTAWVNGHMESWNTLAIEGIEHDALDLVGQLSDILGQMAKTLALIEGPVCNPEITLQRLALDAELSLEE